MRQSAMRTAIIIPVKEPNAYLRESLPVLFMLKGDFEIILLPNEYQGVKPATRVPPRRLGKDAYFNTLGHWGRGQKLISVIPSGPVGPAAKRDLGARLSKCQVLAFLDDDAFPDTQWLKRALPHFKAGISAVGGPAITPPGAGWMEEGLGLVFETLAGGAHARRRYRSHGKPVWVDDWPSVNLLVDRKAFLDVGGFDCPYWPGEDTFFCRAFVASGRQIRYDPGVRVWHHRRPSLLAHLKQVGAYGLHRGYFFKKYPETSRRIAYLAPSLILLWVGGGWVGAPFSLPWAIIWAAAPAGLWGLSLIQAHMLARGSLWRKTLVAGLTATGVIFTHLVYGARFFQGLATKKLVSRLR